TLFVCKLHRYCARVGFETPSFEISINAAWRVILKSAVHRLPAFLRERIPMRTTLTVHHNEHVSSRSFDEVVSAFESAVGSVEDIAFPALLAATKSAEEFESQVKSRESTSGFMRFLTVDHGSWMARVGLNAKARMYTIGNPLIARTMLEHDIAAGLNVPVRLMIYEELASRTTRLTYDLPSSLMSGLKNKKVTAAAKKLDAKLIALAVHATGAQA
ncbi:MAG TPA: DUF302 domain-containing protein, partial [Chthoniobacterales bacterium]|nr:DUF302 domain-containing protein [Chthoniobacterales bacterium]